MFLFFLQSIYQSTTAGCNSLVSVGCSFLYSFKLQLISLFNRSLDLRTCDTATVQHSLATTWCPPAACCRHSQRRGVGGDALTAIGSHNFHPGAAREKHLLNGWQQQPRARAAEGGTRGGGAPGGSAGGGAEGAEGWAAGAGAGCSLLGGFSI